MDSSKSSGVMILVILLPLWVEQLDGKLRYCLSHNDFVRLFSPHAPKTLNSSRSSLRYGGNAGDFHAETLVRGGADIQQLTLFAFEFPLHSSINIPALTFSPTGNSMIRLTVTGRPTSRGPCSKSERPGHDGCTKIYVCMTVPHLSPISPQRRKELLDTA